MTKPINNKLIETLEIKPHEGIGRIKLGMTENEINHIIQNYYSSIKIPNINRVLAPYFNIEYNAAGKAKYIELSRDDEILAAYPAMYKGLKVFTTKANDLITEITKYHAYDPNDFELGYTYIFPEIDMSVWRPIIFKEKDMQEDWFKEMCIENQRDEMKHMYFSTVGVGEKGYYSLSSKSEDVLSLGQNKLINNCKAIESFCELKDFEADGPSVGFEAKRK